MSTVKNKIIPLTQWVDEWNKYWSGKPGHKVLKTASIRQYFRSNPLWDCEVIKNKGRGVLIDAIKYPVKNYSPSLSPKAQKQKERKPYPKGTTRNRTKNLQVWDDRKSYLKLILTKNPKSSAEDLVPRFQHKFDLKPASSLVYVRRCLVELEDVGDILFDYQGRTKLYYVTKEIEAVPSI